LLQTQKPSFVRGEFRGFGLLGGQLGLHGPQRGREAHRAPHFPQSALRVEPKAGALANHNGRVLKTRFHKLVSNEGVFARVHALDLDLFGGSG
jgi:hypothetical protein